jgi:hypothetical protein
VDLAGAVSSNVAEPDEALCVDAWDQCGGTGFSQSKCCKKGWSCVKQDDWFSQCMPMSSSVANTSKADMDVSDEDEMDDSFKSSTRADNSHSSAILIHAPSTGVTVRIHGTLS